MLCVCAVGRRRRRLGRYGKLIEKGGVALVNMERRELGGVVVTGVSLSKVGRNENATSLKGKHCEPQVLVASEIFLCCWIPRISPKDSVLLSSPFSSVSISVPLTSLFSFFSFFSLFQNQILNLFTLVSF